MLLKKITSIFKYFKDFLIGIHIRFKNREEKFKLIYKSSYWKSSTSKSFSGSGSEMSATQNIRKDLFEFIKSENINTILDVPCGDFYWMSQIKLDHLDYTGADIVDEIIEDNKKKYKKKNLKFIKIDIIKDNFKKYDLIINRDCLVHFDNNEIFETLNNIKKSNSTYFGSTIFLEKYSNKKSDKPDKWRPINLTKDPFNLPKPYKLLNDKHNNEFDQFKSFAIWKVKDL